MKNIKIVLLVYLTFFLNCTSQEKIAVLQEKTTKNITISRSLESIDLFSLNIPIRLRVKNDESSSMKIITLSTIDNSKILRSSIYNFPQGTRFYEGGSERISAKNSQIFDVIIGVPITKEETNLLLKEYNYTGGIDKLQGINDSIKIVDYTSFMKNNNKIQFRLKSSQFKITYRIEGDNNFKYYLKSIVW